MLLRSSVGFAAVAALLVACGGKVEVVPVSSGAGGAPTTTSTGGHGGTTTTPQSSVASTPSDAVSTVGVTTGPAPDTSGFVSSSGAGPCTSCGEYIQTAEGTLCPPSDQLYQALIACLCEVACPMPCAGPCQLDGTPQNDDCTHCLDDSISPGGPCQASFEACADDH